jgi:hypothetical protein
MKTEKLRLTEDDQERLNYLTLLQDSLKDFIRPGWFHTRPSAEAVAEYCKQIAYARSQFWRSVGQVYPETREGAWAAHGREVWKTLPDNMPIPKAGSE